MQFPMYPLKFDHTARYLLNIAQALKDAYYVQVAFQVSLYQRVLSFYNFQHQNSPNLALLKMSQ